MGVDAPQPDLSRTAFHDQQVYVWSFRALQAPLLMLYAYDSLCQFVYGYVRVRGIIKARY